MVNRNKGCPLFKKCQAPVTLYHFRKFCNGTDSDKCFVRARDEGKLYVATEWLSIMAIQEPIN